MLKMIRHLFEENKEGMSAAPPATPAANPPQMPAPPQADGGQEYDDLGYAVVSDPGKPPEVAPKPATQTAPAKSPESPSAPEAPTTGYDKEPVVDPPAPKMPPPPAPTAPAVAPSELDKATEGLPDDERAKMKKFAEDHKLTPEIAKAYTEIRKQELSEAQHYAAAQQEEAKRAVQTQRAGWHKELKEDKTFGGENFDASVQKVERVLNEFMPGMKKQLTDKKGMLPPYLMRDLAGIADSLYKTQESLVQGNAPTGGDEDEDDPLAFYGKPN